MQYPFFFFAIGLAKLDRVESRILEVPNGLQTFKKDGILTTTIILFTKTPFVNVDDIVGATQRGQFSRQPYKETCPS